MGRLLADLLGVVALGTTRDEVSHRIHDAVDAYVEEMGALGQRLPEPVGNRIEPGGLTRTGGAAPRYYTGDVPTKLPRHTVTETPRVRAALDELRRRGEHVVLADLVVRGASAVLDDLDRREAEEARDAELRARLVARLKTGEGLDLEAALEARERGWTRE
jgi:hypothetical protein